MIATYCYLPPPPLNQVCPYLKLDNNACQYRYTFGYAVTKGLRGSRVTGKSFQFNKHPSHVYCECTAPGRPLYWRKKNEGMGEPIENCYPFIYLFFGLWGRCTHIYRLQLTAAIQVENKNQQQSKPKEKKNPFVYYVASSSIWSGRFRRSSGLVVELVFFFFFFYLTSIDNDRRVLFRVMLRGHRYEMTQLFTSHISDLIIGLCEIINNCFVSCPTAIYRTFQSVAAPFTICTDLNLFMF